MPVRIEESDENSEEDEEKSAEEELDEAFVNEDIKDKLKIMTLHGMHTTESMIESYKRHKDRTKERQKQRIKNKAKDKVIATVGGGNLKGMASVEEASVPVQKVAKLPSLPNKKAYDIEKASETKKKVSLKPEPWKNKKETKEMVKESVDLIKLKKNAGLL
jgi:hypothetical protein